MAGHAEERDGQPEQYPLIGRAQCRGPDGLHADHLPAAPGAHGIEPNDSDSGPQNGAFQGGLRAGLLN